MNIKRVIILFILMFFSYIKGQINLSDIKIEFQKKIPSEEPVRLEISKDNKTKDSLLIFLTFRMKNHIHVYSSESLFFKVLIDSLRGLGEPIIVLPTSVMFKNFDKSVVPVFVDGHKIKIMCGTKNPRWLISGILNFQACDTAMCFTPVAMRFKASSEGELSIIKENFIPTQASEVTEDVFKLLEKFNIVGMAGGYLDKKSFSEFLTNPSKKKKDSFSDKNIFLIILLILIGGVALNFTPCVLPIIPVTLAIIGAGSKAKSKTDGFLSGALYGLSMAITYGVLGAIVIISGTQFGIINSSPVFNITVSIIFFIMALALFDIFQIDFSRFRKGSNIINKSKYVGIFIMGILTSLLAGACVAPVVISVVLYAGSLYAKGNVGALFFPFLLGIGMALPWPIVGAGLASLPKPGNWMIWLKKFFGVVILMIAVYYGYSGIMPYVKDSFVKKSKMLREKEEIGWYSSLSEALNIALMEDKPVFIDFWATWCKNCKAMDATTFREEEVIEILKRYVCVKYQAENPKEESTSKILNYFKIVGLPSYVVLEKKGEK